MSASKVEFYVSCKGLKKSEVLSKSDPFAVVSVGHTNKDGKIKYKEFGRTETIGNTSDPEFTKQFVLDFHFNEIQYIRVDMHEGDKVSDGDSLGTAEFTLGELMSAPGRSVNEILQDDRGVMIIRGEEVASCADQCKLTIRGIKLKNKDSLVGKSDPFFTLSRIREDEKWQQVHKSEVVMNDLSPLWTPQDISVQALCNGDYLRPLRLEIWDWDQDGGHECMGRLTTSLQALLEGQGHEMGLEHPTNNTQGEGHIRVEHAEIHKQETLLEHLAGGLQIDFSSTCAIDFTRPDHAVPTHSQQHNPETFLERCADSAKAAYVSLREWLGSAKAGKIGGGFIRAGCQLPWYRYLVAYPMLVAKAGATATGSGSGGGDAGEFEFCYNEEAWCLTVPVAVFVILGSLCLVGCAKVFNCVGRCCRSARETALTDGATAAQPQGYGSVEMERVRVRMRFRTVRGNPADVFLAPPFYPIQVV